MVLCLNSKPSLPFLCFNEARIYILMRLHRILWNETFTRSTSFDCFCPISKENEEMLPYSSSSPTVPFLSSINLWLFRTHAFLMISLRSDWRTDVSQISSRKERAFMWFLEQLETAVYSLSNRALLYESRWIVWFWSFLLIKEKSRWSGLESLIVRLLSEGIIWGLTNGELACARDLLEIATKSKYPRMHS